MPSKFNTAYHGKLYEAILDITCQDTEVFIIEAINESEIISTQEKVPEIQTLGKYKSRTDYNRYQRSDSGEFVCRLHGNHRRRECRVICGFCGLGGSHYGRDCWKQNQIIREFIEKKIQKYGIMAKSAAESLIKDYGIQRMKDEEFEKMLRNTHNQQNGSYEGSR